MSDATAIGLVGASLRTLLLNELGLTPMPKVTVLAPDETGDAPRLNLFLYRVMEHPFLRNQDWTPAPDDPQQLTAPPLSLTLTYLLTPYAPNDPVTGNTAAHQLLGAAMRVFYEHPEIPEPYLEPGLVGAKERLRIVGDTFDPEALGRLWTTFTEPFRLSVAYQVSPVQLDVAAAPRPLPRRVERTGVPDVRAPFVPPLVTAMTPERGPAGTVLTFTGAHLTGWRGHVWVGGRLVAQDLPLTDDRFTAVLPAGLPAGLYDVRAEVSGLFRRTFVFEVTT
jgi:hypothetical protein